MMDVSYTKQALRDLKRLPRDVQKRIVVKLDFYTASPDPIAFANRLINSDIGEYRYRIGDYRVVFDVYDEKMVVLTIGHRREIYK